MAQQFATIEELNDYLDFLEMKGKPVPQWVLDEKDRFERENKINDDEYIYSTFAAHNKFMTEEKDKVVREMVDQLLTDASNATQPCLLLGKVQCGKTDTFISIMSLAFDRGIDIAVVLTKGTKTLAGQTINRLQSKEKGLGRFLKNGRYDQKSIINIMDILNVYHRGGIADNQLTDTRNKFIIVCKKEATNLQYLNELFANNELLRVKKVLVCDDEADFASRAYRKAKGTKRDLELLKISELIEEFTTKNTQYCRYLQITATPYSLYLQPDGTIHLRDGEEATSWLPRYTGLVPIHGMYIGGQQYYVDSENPDSMYSQLYIPVSETCNNILSERNEWYLSDTAHRENLRELTYGIICYLFGTAIRKIQHKKSAGEEYKSSCLIHCEVNKAGHAWQEDLITNIMNDVRDTFVNKCNANMYVLDLEQQAYESLKESNRLGNAEGLILEDFPEFIEIEYTVKDLLEASDYIIKVVNSDNPVDTMIDNNPDSKDYGQLRLEQTLNFFIGGGILDRGITISNMLSFFYGRDPEKKQMDAVLQHARMYGARKKEDMACTRFLTTVEIYDVLKKINEIDDLMYDYLKAHRDSVRSNDFTSMVLGYDKRINLTAANKYTPSNVKTVKAHQRTYPVGFQTLVPGEEMNEAMTQIENIIAKGKQLTPETQSEAFQMHYNDVVEILKLIRKTYIYAEEYNNLGMEWDINEMITPLDHTTYDTDGMIWVCVKENRNASRERENIYDPRGRFIDAPESGSEITSDRNLAEDRPVLVLLKENGTTEAGWMGTPFYWPTLTNPRQMNAGIFTINSIKKDRTVKTQKKIPALKNYNMDEVLSLVIKKDMFIAILAGDKDVETRQIKHTTCSMFLEKDFMGNFILIDGTNPDKYYNLRSYNDGVFPFEIKNYKYLYLRTSHDYSGSQAIVELDAEEPYNLLFDRLSQKDIIYNKANIGSDVEDDQICDWCIAYNMKKVRETMLTPQDEQYLQDYKADM